MAAAARRANERLAASRDVARAEAVAAIRLLEEALAGALVPDRLRGLRPLCGGDLYAVQVRRAVPDAPLEIPNAVGEVRESLVLTADGRLSIARAAVGARGAVYPVVRRVQDEELVAEDVERVSRAIVVAVSRHVEACERGEVRYEHLRGLARRVAAVVAA